MPPVYVDPGRPRTTKAGLPSVQIQGTSISRSPRPRELGSELNARATMPVTPVPSPQPYPVAQIATPAAPPITPVPSPINLAAEVPVIEIKEDDAPKEEDLPTAPPTDQRGIVPKIIKLDKSVNMPSIDGDDSHREEVTLTPRVVRLQQANQAEVGSGDLANQKTEKPEMTSPLANQESGEQTNTGLQTEEAGGNGQSPDKESAVDENLLAKSKKGKVRFADEKSQNEDEVSKSEGSVVFFITEENDEDQVVEPHSCDSDPLVATDVAVNPLPTAEPSQANQNSTGSIERSESLENRKFTPTVDDKQTSVILNANAESDPAQNAVDAGNNYEASPKNDEEIVENGSIQSEEDEAAAADIICVAIAVKPSILDEGNVENAASEQAQTEPKN